MLKQLRKRTEGFTIIEVMIVLAIAGLILLIVFLAVPALQRNSRNTQSKSDAAALLGATQEWSNNNNGISPTATTSCDVACIATAITGLAKTKNITTMTVVPATGTAGAAFTNASVVPTLNNAVLISNAKCPNGGGAITIAGTPASGTVTVGTSTRQYVIVYGIEDRAGALTGICTES